jgi:hypothetical protein
VVSRSPQDRKPSDHCHPREVLELLPAVVRPSNCWQLPQAKNWQSSSMQEVGRRKSCWM